MAYDLASRMKGGYDLLFVCLSEMGRQAEALELLTTQGDRIDIAEIIEHLPREAMLGDLLPVLTQCLVRHEHALKKSAVERALVKQ